MRTMMINVYKFDELTDDAKEKAREWWKTDLEYPWYDDAMSSIRTFCGHFNVSIKDWEIGPWMPSYVSTDAENQNFRGVKLKDIDREQMPTGYCLDCTLWYTFYDEFKRTGDAYYAFKEAIDAVVDEIQKDAEWQYTDEAVDEMLTINEYEFHEDGSIA